MPETETPVAEPELLSIAEAQAMIDPLPEVNPKAIAAEEARQEAAPAEEAASPHPARPQPPPPVAPASQQAKPKAGKRAPVDHKGRTHDPLIHETYDDGRPVLRSDGVTLKCRRHPLKEWRTKSRVGLDDPEAPESTIDATTDGQGPLSADERAMELDASAATLAGLQLMMMKAALGSRIGDEDAQRQELVRSWVRVFKHYDMGELHPLVSLGMVTGGIVVAGLQHEETQGRFRKLSNWFQHRMLSLWQWLTGRRNNWPKETGEPGEPA